MSATKSWPLLKSKNKNPGDGDTSDQTGTDEEHAKNLAAVQKWFANNTKGKTDAEKRLFFLNYYIAAPEIYLLSKGLHDQPLPSPTELKDLKLYFDACISEDLIKHLGKRLYKVPYAKFVNLHLDLMPLTPEVAYDQKTDKTIGYQEIDGKRANIFCTNAFTVVLGSGVVNFTQPLGYAFIANPEECYKELSDWIDKLIKSLNSIGFEVCAVVSKQGSGFAGFAEFKGVTIGKPYFEVDGKRVFYIVDAQDLMISMRDTLRQTDLVYDGDKLVSWSDIIEVNKQEQILSQAHFNPTPDQNDLLLASEIFDDKLASALKAKHSPKVNGTACFLSTMDKLFNIIIMNRKNYTPEQLFTGIPDLVESSKTALAMFKSIKPVNDIANGDQIDMTCFNSIQITVNATIQMHKYYLPPHSRSVLMRKLSLSPSLKLQEEISKETGMEKPTSIKFQQAISKLMLSYIIDNAADCPDDDLLECIKFKSFVPLFKDPIATE